MSDLRFPSHLRADQRRLIEDLHRRNKQGHGADLLGLVLSGSAGRDLMTEHSDVDVYVVLADGTDRTTEHAREVDEIPVTIGELRDLPSFGTEGWFGRWSFAWAPVLIDSTGGEVTRLAARQARVDEAEQRAILIDHDRLDGYVNYAYRALKNDRDGRPLETRLDAAESVPWLLDTVFTLAGRVRPYMKYLPWELRTHPVAGWPAEETLALLEATLQGDPAAIRQTFGRVRAACTAYDEERGASELTDLIDGWGDELALLA